MNTWVCCCLSNLGSTYSSCVQKLSLCSSFVCLYSCILLMWEMRYVEVWSMLTTTISINKFHLEGNILHGQNWVGQWWLIWCWRREDQIPVWKWGLGHDPTTWTSCVVTLSELHLTVDVTALHSWFCGKLLFCDIVCSPISVRPTWDLS